MSKPQFYQSGNLVSIPDQFQHLLTYNSDAHSEGVNTRKSPGTSEFHKYEFYCDREKEWAFYTGNEGASLLVGLFEECDKALKVCDKRIQATEDPDETERQGETLYSKKPSIAGKGVTWSQEEYRHPGLQKRYIQLKSVQRFTEGYSMYQRMYNEGFFQPYIEADISYQLCKKMVSPSEDSSITCPASLPSVPNGTVSRPRPFVAVSLGGGPAFELLALRAFMKLICPNTPVINVSIDLEDIWMDYVVAMDMHFIAMDLNGPGLKERIANELARRNIGIPSTSSDAACEDAPAPAAATVPHVDLHVLSYVYYMYMSDDVSRPQISALLAAGPAASAGAEAEAEVDDDDIPSSGLVASKTVSITVPFQPQPVSIPDPTTPVDADLAADPSSSSLPAHGVAILDRKPFQPSFDKIEHESDTIVTRLVRPGRDDRMAVLSRRCVRGQATRLLRAENCVVTDRGAGHVAGTEQGDVSVVELDCAREPIVAYNDLFKVDARDIKPIITNITSSVTSSVTQVITGVSGLRLVCAPCWAAFPNIPYQDSYKRAWGVRQQQQRAGAYSANQSRGRGPAQGYHGGGGQYPRRSRSRDRMYTERSVEYAPRGRGHDDGEVPSSSRYSAVAPRKSRFSEDQDAEPAAKRSRFSDDRYSDRGSDRYSDRGGDRHTDRYSDRYSRDHSTSGLRSDRPRDRDYARDRHHDRHRDRSRDARDTYDSRDGRGRDRDYTRDRRREGDRDSHRDSHSRREGDRDSHSRRDSGRDRASGRSQERRHGSERRERSRTQDGDRDRQTSHDELPSGRDSWSRRPAAATSSRDHREPSRDHDRKSKSWADTVGKSDRSVDSKKTVNESSSHMTGNKSETRMDFSNVAVRDDGFGSIPDDE